MRISYWSSGLCSSDLRIFVALDPARQGHELARTVGLGELARAPAGIAALAIGDDPDLEQRRFLILEVELAVRHAGAGAHHLDVARRGAAGRSEERRVGTGWVRTLRYWVSTSHSK